ncbi:hypothetical protein GX50_07603 [[Emmonsia] crescens]|uniref:Nuclear transport factor 2 n=1 Tax=[Emmonsia] crescens TaxID=73230 RepID=A0A2B7Z7T1_9EURO|nr:hypothetical protein GX50_07603 [Emmonsia crescens]
MAGESLLRFLSFRAASSLPVVLAPLILSAFVRYYQTVAEHFVKFYYTAFDSIKRTNNKDDEKEVVDEGRDGLRALYRDESMLTFETVCVSGTNAIMEQLMGMPFQKVKHVQSTVDAQPTEEGGVVILVTGALMIDEEQKPMNYSQVFHLRRDGASYYVFNDIFKLVYPQ